MPQTTSKEPWISPLAKAEDEDRWTHVLSRLHERHGVVCNATDLVRFETRIKLAEAQRIAEQPYPVIYPQFESEDTQRGKQYWLAKKADASFALVVDKPTMKIVSVRAKPETT